MKKRFIYTVFSTALVVVLFLSNSNGPTAGGAGARTGAPGEGLCTNCHGGGSAGGVGITIQLLSGGSPVFSYVPGQSYTLRIQMTGGNSCYGAQATVLRNSNNTTAGTLSGASAGAAIRNFGARTYLEHTTQSSTGLFTATWVAPAGGTGNVTIYAAGIACNGSTGSNGDNGINGSIVISEASVTTITYTTSSLCAGGGSSPAASITGTTGGTFSAPAGLSINTSTGVINLAASAAGNYAVSYTYSGTSVTTTSVTLQPREVADFSYSASAYCQDIASVAPNMAGTTTGGVFSASPAGLSINSATGVITPNASAAGTYSVQYRTTGTCPDTFALNVQIQALADAAFAYSSASYCQAQVSTTPSSIANGGGTFSAEPAGLSIDAATGSIDLNGSSLGTYNILYTTSGVCNDTDTISLTVNANGDASFAYAANVLCSDGSPQTPTISGNSGGTFSSLQPNLSLDATTGAIDPSASDFGVYDIVYTIGGACPAADTISIEVARADTLTLSFPQDVLDNGFFCLSQYTPTIGGNTTGIFSSDNNTIIYLDTITGEFDPEQSAWQEFNPTMIYQSQGVCPDTVRFPLDLAGCESVERNSVMDMRLYPNPSDGICWLELDNAAPQNADIEIRDALGREVMRQHATLEAGTQRLSIDLSRLPQGLYWLRLSSERANSNFMPLRRE